MLRRGGEREEKEGKEGKEGKEKGKEEGEGERERGHFSMCSPCRQPQIFIVY